VVPHPKQPKPKPVGPGEFYSREQRGGLGYGYENFLFIYIDLGKKLMSLTVIIFSINPGHVSWDDFGPISIFQSRTSVGQKQETAKLGKGASDPDSFRRHINTPLDQKTKTKNVKRSVY